MPHARPAFASSYRKISGKSIPLAKIYVNAEVKRDLTWFAKRLRSGSELSLIRRNCWDLLRCLPRGHGFLVPFAWKGFLFRCLPEFDRNSNFCEAATIISALQWALSLELPPHPRVLIYSDNLAAVEVFSSMRAKPPYYHMTMQAAAWIHDHGVLWRTLRVPGLDHSIADYVSRGMLDRVQFLSTRRC